MESFVLSQSIASSCGAPAGGNTLGKPSQWDQSNCGWDMGNLVVWTEDNNGCNVAYPENGEFNGYCFNNPEGGTSIFGSF